MVLSLANILIFDPFALKFTVNISLLTASLHSKLFQYTLLCNEVTQHRMNEYCFFIVTSGNFEAFQYFTLFEFFSFSALIFLIFSCARWTKTQKVNIMKTWFCAHGNLDAITRRLNLRKDNQCWKGAKTVEWVQRTGVKWGQKWRQGNVEGM